MTWVPQGATYSARWSPQGPNSSSVGLRRCIYLLYLGRPRAKSSMKLFLLSWDLTNTHGYCTCNHAIYLITDALWELGINVSYDKVSWWRSLCEKPLAETPRYEYDYSLYVNFFTKLKCKQTDYIVIVHPVRQSLKFYLVGLIRL